MAEDPQTVPSSSRLSPVQQPQEENVKQKQVPEVSSFSAFPNADIQMVPILYPAIVPALVPIQNQEHVNRGAGIYAVPSFPFMGPITGLPSNTLIPLTYNIPTRTSPDVGAVHEEHGQVGAEQQQQQPQHPAPQRQVVVVRRFQIAFQLDLFLILKLAAVILLFNQDGSRQRLVVLVLCASLVYLYQTGALTPFIRWLSQGMQRAAAPPRPPRPAPPPAARPEIDNAALGAEEQHRAELENQLNMRNQANDNVVGAENGGNNWWGVVKEIQMIVFGFITSLLPGFHNID